MKKISSFTLMMLFAACDTYAAPNTSLKGRLAQQTASSNILAETKPSDNLGGGWDDDCGCDVPLNLPPITLPDL